ncbi:MAG: tetratricopeptide repeat protein [Gammaproteobacteria bacterium]
MSLTSFFPEQFDQLKGFFISATDVVRHLKIDPEMRPLLFKALARMEDDPEFPHALTRYSQPFAEPVSYFEGMLEILRQSMPTPPDSKTSALKAPARFTRYASALAEKLPDNVGSLVFVLNPDSVADVPAYRKSIAYLAEHIRSDWVKFLVLDSRAEPLLEGIERERSRIGVQTLYLSPQEIEQRVREDLQSPAALSPAERRQYKGLLAGFAFSNKDYDQAAELQRAWASEAVQEEEHGDAASAYYNLGNTLLAKGDWSEATAAFCSACELCVEHQVNGLAPFVYANLGVSLHRQQQFAQAFAALKVARDMFKAQNYRAGEAFVVDTLAQMYALDGRNSEAERSWRYCLSLYDGMTSSTFRDVRAAGRSEVIAKLAKLGVSACQTPPPAQPDRAEASRR